MVGKYQVTLSPAIVTGEGRLSMREAGKTGSLVSVYLSLNLSVDGVVVGHGFDRRFAAGVVQEVREGSDNARKHPTLGTNTKQFEARVRHVSTAGEEGGHRRRPSETRWTKYTNQATGVQTKFGRSNKSQNNSRQH